MSGWVISRNQPSTAVWGGVTGRLNAPPPTPVPASGWAVYRFQPSMAVWGGIAAVSNVAPPVVAPPVAALSGFQDRRPGYLKKRILFGM